MQHFRRMNFVISLGVLLGLSLSAACMAGPSGITTYNGFVLRKEAIFPLICAEGVTVIDSEAAMEQAAGSLCGGGLSNSIKTTAIDFSKSNMVVFVGPGQPSLSNKIAIQSVSRLGDTMKVSYKIVVPSGVAAMSATPYIVGEVEKGIRNVVFSAI